MSAGQASFVSQDMNCLVSWKPRIPFSLTLPLGPCKAWSRAGIWLWCRVVHWIVISIYLKTFFQLEICSSRQNGVEFHQKTNEVCFTIDMTAKLATWRQFLFIYPFLLIHALAGQVCSVFWCLDENSWVRQVTLILAN